MRFPEIDYDTHPAYSPFRTATIYDEDFLAQQVRTADLAYTAFCSIAEPTQRAAEQALQQIHESADRFVLHARRQNMPAIAEEWLHSCARWTVNDIAYELARRVLSARQHRSLALSPVHAEQLSAMQTQGMYVSALPGDAYGEIRRLSLTFLGQLKQQAAKNPFERAVASVKYNSPLWRAIKSAARQAGIFDVLGELKKNRMTMLGAGLEYSSSEQNWHQNIYADVGLSDSPFQYLHFDEGYSIPKAMIYATPVTDANGPTRAIPGSNCWEASEFRLRMYRALDRIVGDRYGSLGSAGNYRPLARRSELRRIFMQLPAAVRGSSHFGDDVLPGTAAAEALSGREIQYLSNDAQTFVFDGPHLLHRGSIVRDGERLALQVAFRNRNEAIIRSNLAKETFVREQLALGRKYARKFVMAYL
jgi:hypothetical protein